MKQELICALWVLLVLMAIPMSAEVPPVEPVLQYTLEGEDLPRYTLFTQFLSLVESVYSHPVLQESQLAGRTEDSRLAIYIEEGATTPEQALLRLDRVATVKLTITYGPAVFRDKEDPTGTVEDLKEVTYQSQMVRLPRLRTARVGYDSEILIHVNGRLIGDPLRVATLNPGIIDLYTVMEPMKPGLLLLDLASRYAVVDQSLVGDILGWASTLHGQRVLATHQKMATRRQHSGH